MDRPCRESPRKCGKTVLLFQIFMEYLLYEGAASEQIIGLMQIPNADIYVTCSNSRMLSSDILTQFRDRDDEICVHPLSFAE